MLLLRVLIIFFYLELFFEGRFEVSFVEEKIVLEFFVVLNVNYVCDLSFFRSLEYCIFGTRSEFS